MSEKYEEVDIFFENEDNVYPDSEFAGSIVINGEIVALQLFLNDQMVRFVKEARK